MRHDSGLNHLGLHPPTATRTTATSTTATSTESKGLERLVQAARRRQLHTPLLLLLASHQPLTFVAGQLLYALEPLCLLFGWEEVTGWAKLLSAPDANRRMADALQATQNPSQDIRFSEKPVSNHPLRPE